MNNKNFYCTILLKQYSGIRAIIAKRLNSKGLRTKRGNEYTFAIVNNVLSGMYSDDNVEQEFKLLAYEAGYTDEQIERFEESFATV